jgi:hypothetical protein
VAAIAMQLAGARGVKPDSGKRGAEEENGLSQLLAS